MRSAVCSGLVRTLVYALDPVSGIVFWISLFEDQLAEVVRLKAKRALYPTDGL